MAQDNLVKLVNKETKEVYWTKKNRKKLADIKLEQKNIAKSCAKESSLKSQKNSEKSGRKTAFLL